MTICRFSRVAIDLYARVSAHFDDEQMVALTAFGAMMVATNIINNALDVPLDDYLMEYRKAQPSASTSSGNPSTGSG